MIKFYKRLQIMKGGDTSYTKSIFNFIEKKGGCLNDKENRNSIAFKTIRIHTTL